MLDLERIVELQRELDNSIHEIRQVSYDTTFEHRKLALLVELGELANEVRSFKFWSSKAPSAKEIILEEFVDCLHFCISLGIGMKIDFANCYVLEIDIKDTSAMFNQTIARVVELDENNNSTYYEMFSYVINLALLLGFKSEEIFTAYLDKNKVNHERQENNY